MGRRTRQEPGKLGLINGKENGDKGVATRWSAAGACRGTNVSLNELKAVFVFNNECWQFNKVLEVPSAVLRLGIYLYKTEQVVLDLVCKAIRQPVEVFKLIGNRSPFVVAFDTKSGVGSFIPQ